MRVVEERNDEKPKRGDTFKVEEKVFLAVLGVSASIASLVSLYQKQWALGVGIGFGVFCLVVAILFALRNEDRYR